MSEAWYYVDSERAVGPIAISELAHILRSRPDWSITLVWRKGLPDWQRAGEVSELEKWMEAPPSVPSTRQANATAALQESKNVDRKIRWARPRNLAILGASTSYGWYLALQKYSIIGGFLTGLFSGVLTGIILVVIVEMLASAARLLRQKFPRTAFYVGTIAFWLGFLVLVWCAGVVVYLIYEAAPLKLVLIIAGSGVAYASLGWALQRGLAAGFKDVSKR